MLKDVRDVIVIMGMFEDFGVEFIDEILLEEGFEWVYCCMYDYWIGCCLFCNFEDEVIGGVCFGIVVYFGISDLFWIWFVFIVVMIFGGFGILVYIIFWAILLKVEMASDCFVMCGELINVFNIGCIIEEEIEYIFSKVFEFGNEFGGKKKGVIGGGMLGEVLW